MTCRSTGKACIVLTALLLAGSNGWAEEDQRLEMWEEPSHQLVFLEGPARVLDVRIVPGVTSDYHKHRFATVYVIIQDALVANQNWDKEWTASGPRDYRAPGATADMSSSYVEKPSYHRVRNEDERAFHVLAVINERSQAALTAVSSTAGNSAIVENPWFREHRIRVAPGKNSEVLSFGNDVVVVQYAAGSSHVIENGIAHGFKGAPAAFSWHPAGTGFSIANRSDLEMEFVLVEVKE